MQTRVRTFRPTSRLPGLAGVIIPCLLLLARAGAPEASQVRLVNLEEMAQRADRIFWGRCVDVRAGRDAVLDRSVTWATFVVQRAVKGNLHGRVTIKVLGVTGPATSRDGMIEGLPRFEPGEEVVLFLHGDSARGLTSPVGFSQGKFVVARDKQGRPIALNGMTNERLFRGISQRAQERLSAHAARWKDEQGLPPDDLLDMVEALQK